MKASVIGFDPLYRALYFWLDEWSRAAKRAISRRDWLLSLGLAKRRRPGSAAESDASDASDTAEE